MTRKILLTRAGYDVHTANGVQDAKRILEKQTFAVVIFGAGVATADASALAKEIRRMSARTRLVATGQQAMRAAVDGFLEPQQRPEAFLRLIGSLLMQAHGHPEVSGKYVMYVDAERRYINVTDGICQLLGYPREDLLAMTIDQLTFPKTANVPKQFEKFVDDGQQQGRFLLRHADDSPVPVRFKARVLADGCMVSVLAPAKISQSMKSNSRRKAK